MKSIAVVGIGNILFQDEGIGCYAGKILEENYIFSNAIEFVDGGTLGFKLMTYFQSFEKVLIIDTVSIEAAAGSVHTLDTEGVMNVSRNRQTAHEVEVVEMLEICSILDNMAEVSMVGMVPEDIVSVNIGLTDTVKQAFPALMAEVIAELERSGVTCKSKTVQKSLDEVIAAYNTPSHADCFA